MDRETDQPTQIFKSRYSRKVVKPTNMVFHAMSHVESYTEKQLKVQRPRLTITRLDPEFYLSNRYKRPTSLPTDESVDAEANFEENMRLSKGHIEVPMAQLLEAIEEDEEQEMQQNSQKQLPDIETVLSNTKRSTAPTGREHDSKPFSTTDREKKEVNFD